MRSRMYVWSNFVSNIIIGKTVLISKGFLNHMQIKELLHRNCTETYRINGMCLIFVSVVHILSASFTEPVSSRDLGSHIQHPHKFRRRSGLMVSS